MSRAPITPLDAYLLEQNISDAAFASQINRDRSMVNKLRLGKLRPTLDVAAAIEAKTEGAIPMQIWTDLSQQAAA